MKSIKIKNIKKTFFSMRRGKINALKGIDIDIEAGKFFVLLGPSGCGKSTLLNIIAGIEKPSEGEIYFGDKLVSSSSSKIFLSPKERDVAMVFQSYALYPHMSVFANIAFPLKMAKKSKEEINKKVKNAAEVLELSDMLEAKPGELSGGQRQRVALGRAIVRKPNVLLLDEPLSNLDAMLRISMRSELKDIQREFNLTTIYVTHDQTEAMSLGDSIAVLREGEIQQIGTPDEIYDQPSNFFVAKFIGTPPMNEIIVKKFDNKIVEYFSNDFLNNVTLGVRPEHMKIVNPDEGTFNARLKMIGNLGSERILYLENNGIEMLAKVTGKIPFKEGDRIGIFIKKEDIFTFESKKGTRIKQN